MNYQRSSQFGGSSQSTSVSNSLTPKHVCSLCGKTRSKRYHYYHPLLPGQVPESGVCSRPKCARAVHETLRLPYQLIVHETHYHYHSGSGLEGPPPSYAATELLLPNNTVRLSRHSPRDFSPVSEVPPFVNINSGSEDTPAAYTTAELSGDSFLAGRVELPANRCSRRCPLGRLSPIQEESPPPVNFLKKPKLQEK